LMSGYGLKSKLLSFRNVDRMDINKIVFVAVDRARA